MLAQSDIEREIYEGREKARRDERAKMSGALEQGLTRGIQQGIQQGIEKGTLLGQIQVYQELLGLEQTSRAELETMNVEDLPRIADELRRQFSR